MLARSDREQALDVLVGMLEQPGLRLAAATGLGRLGTQRCHPLLGLLRDSDPRVRTAAAQGLARCPEAGVADLAGALVEEEDAGTRGALITTIGELGGREAVTALTQMQTDEDVATRFALAQALGRTAAKEAFAPLMRLLDDPAPEVRIAALNALGELGDARASQAVELHRRFAAIRFSAVEVGRRAATAPHRDDRLFVEQLVDLTCGLLAAPLSEETRRLAGERPRRRRAAS